MGLVRWIKWRSSSGRSSLASSHARLSACDGGALQRYSACAPMQTLAAKAATANELRRWRQGHWLAFIVCLRGSIGAAHRNRWTYCVPNNGFQSLSGLNQVLNVLKIPFAATRRLSTARIQTADARAAKTARRLGDILVENRPARVYIWGVAASSPIHGQLFWLNPDP